MRALAMSGLGGPEVLEVVDVAEPTVGASEVLVRVETVGVNRLDLATMRGEGLAHGVQPGHIPGIDPAGTIVWTGADVEGLAVGDRVVVRPVVTCETCPWCVDGFDDSCDSLAFVGIHRPGGFAEFVAVPARNAFALPDGVGFAEATAFAHSFPVALQMLRERGGIVPGDVVLVTGSSGAVGAAAVQLALHAGGRVVAAAGSAARARRALDLGAELAVDYGASPDFAGQLLDLVPDGIDICIETTGSPILWRQVEAAMGKRGRLVVCGGHAGGRVELDLFWLFRSRVAVIGSAAASALAFTDALAAFVDGGLTAPIGARVRFEDHPRAFGCLEDRELAGKIILDFEESAA